MWIESPAAISPAGTSVVSHLDDSGEPVFTVPTQDAPESFVRQLRSFNFESLPRFVSIQGYLPELQGAYSKMVASYLKAALVETMKKPDGTIQIQRAVKMITGDDSITGSQAADVVKRLLGMSPEILPELLKDPVLKEAHTKALKLRPTKSQKQSKRKKTRTTKKGTENKGSQP